MLDREAQSSVTVRTFREHRWIVRLLALWAAVAILIPVLKALIGSSRGPWWVIVSLGVLGMTIPAAVLVWDHRRGVHVLHNGIRSVSANGSRFISWSEIAEFQIDGYIAGTNAIFVVQQNGARMPLGDTARWSYQRKSLEQVRDQLAGYKQRWTQSGDQAARTDI
jgi:hypothetical protein